MNPFAAYRAVNTKIHAKKRTLLSQKEWEKIAQYKEVSEVVEFLKKREGYMKQMMAYKVNELHRTDLEIILDRYCVHEIENMLHYFSGDYKDFFRVFLMAYEIEDLGLILRTISRNDDMEGIERLFVHSERWSQGDYDKLLNCKDTIGFIEALKGTIYYAALKTLTNDDLLRREFHLEMKLYQVFYKELMEKASKLKGRDQCLAKEVIGTKIDFLNAQWIYRALRYYDLSPEETLIYSLSSGKKLGYHRLKVLCYSKTIEDFTKHVEKELGYSLFKNQNDAFLDCMTDRYLYQFARRLEKNDESIATTLAYIMLLGVEVNDLIALTEGIRYQLGERELGSYLVHTT